MDIEKLKEATYLLDAIDRQERMLAALRRGIRARKSFLLSIEDEGGAYAVKGLLIDLVLKEMQEQLDANKSKFENL